MKITIIQGAFLPVPPLMGGAVEKVWHALGGEFARRGHEVTHISRRWGDLPNGEVSDGVRHLRVAGFDTPRSVFRLKVLDLIYSWRVSRRLPAADILVTNTFWLPVLVKDPALGRLYVHVARFPKGQMRLYGGVARLQTVSGAIAQAISEEVPRLASKVRVIPYPLIDEWEREDEAIRRERRILYAGRVHPEKGLDLLIRAMVSLPAGLMADWKLVIVGPAEIAAGGGGAQYLEELKRLAEPIAGSVEWVGSVFDLGELAAHYRRASLFVYPSLAERGETFGLAPLEAMSHGCAPLVSDLACFKDHIDNEVTGFVFDHRAPNPVTTLSDRIAALAGDEARLAAVGAAARRKAAEYCLPRIADRFLRDFESLRQPESSAEAKGVSVRPTKALSSIE